jgi:hypothetical protein
VYSANVDVPMKWRSRSPSLLSRVFCCSRIARQRFVFGERRVGADLLHDAGALVAEHGRRVAGRSAPDAV